jgi:twinkle protein
MISMENCLRKYGCKLFILDNLMTIDIGSDADSELKKQTETINQLIAFAIKWQCAVVLVCHPRKMAAGEDVGIYDLSGTANIINLAHRSLSLRRIDNEKESSNYNVKLTIIKDRLFGRSNKHIDLYYDVPSRRFYTNNNEYNYHYRWEKENKLQTKDLDNIHFTEQKDNSEEEVYGDIF